MDQPKIQRILRLMVLLSGQRAYSLDELADEIGMSGRTIYRYISSFREAGFVIDKVGECRFRLLSLGPGTVDLKNIVHFSPEEAFILSRMIDSLDPSNSLKAELLRKLSAVYDSTSVVNLSSRPTSSSKIDALLDAIRSEKMVRILSYSSSHSGVMKDYTVEPFELTEDYSGVSAFDPTDGKNNLFKILRIGEVQRTDSGWSNAISHHSVPMDDFRFHGDKEYHVVLRLNTLAKNLLIEEYPLTERHLSRQDGIEVLQENIYTMEDLTLPAHDMEDEKEEFWIYDASVRGLDSIGRFVLGLEGNMEVMEGDALIEYLLFHADHIKEIYG